MAKSKLLVSLCLLTLFFCTPPTKLVKGKFTHTNMHSPRKFLIQAINKDPIGNFWGIGSSDFWGFDEFWITKSLDSLSWSPPLYTGIPAERANYIWQARPDSLLLSQNNNTGRRNDFFYRREHFPSNKRDYKFCMQQLLKDSDRDGLTDYMEQFIDTSINSNDTDGDGKADGFDNNPLAAPAQKLKIHEKLHKHIIEYVIDDFISNQLLIVEQIRNKPMEYHREAGYVLSMPSKQIDAFLDKNGYGVPILSTIISDTLKMYKVQFDFFVSPEDAWGFDALYDWDRIEEKWVEKTTLLDWEAEYTGIPTLKRIIDKDWPTQYNRIRIKRKIEKRHIYKAVIKRMPKFSKDRTEFQSQNENNLRK